MKCRSEHTETDILRCFCLRTTSFIGHLINFKGQNGPLYKQAHVHRVLKGSNQLYILLCSILLTFPRNDGITRDQIIDVFCD
jgi:hypothetical protein